MPDLKISGLTALTAADTADLLEIVDVSDTSMAATGTNKKITAGQVLASGLPGSFSTLAASGGMSAQQASQVQPVRLGQVSSDVTYGGISFNGAYASTTMQGIWGGGGDSVLVFAVPTGHSFLTRVNNSTITAVSSTGLAITGAITASTTGKVGTTLGVGNATPSASGAGITFPATVSASTDVNTLDDYVEYTAASAACTGAITTAAVWKLTKVGNVVTLTMPAVTGTASATGSIVFGTNLPAKYRPAAIARATVCVRDNAANVTTGMLDIGSDGVMTLYKDASGTNFTNAASAGLPVSVGTSWTI